MKNTYCFLVLNCLLLASSLCAQHATVEPTDRPVALAGMMRIEHAYGPPGYGEDPRVDIKVSYLALQLAFKVTTVCTPQLPQLESIQCGSTDTLRLEFPTNAEAADLRNKARALVGRRVLLTGVLHRQRAKADYTAVYMDVAEVSEVSTKNRALPKE